MDLIMPEASSIAKIVTCTIEGILEEDDLRVIATPAASAPAPEVDDPSVLVRVKEKHHSVARMIASGLPQRQVAALAGYTESYLSILLNNPAMEELVMLYRTRQGGAAEVIGEKLRTVGLKAMEKLEERLDATGEDAMDDHALLGVAKLGLDRSGHGPSSTQHTVSEHHLIDHARIRELNEGARRRSASRIVPVDTVRQALLPTPTSEADDENA